MAVPKPAFRLPLDRARKVFLANQGFPPRGQRSLSVLLEETGFVRTLGGMDVYLAVRARRPGLRREDLDAAVAERAAQVVPSVRGCMYLVPRRYVPLSLRVADLLSRSRAEREHEKAGIQPGEVAAVGEAALRVLEERGPLTTDALRKALPAETVRSLGEAGKKVGISSPLPPALRLLEFDGRVERALDGTRLDTERYLWRIPDQSPFAEADLPEDPLDLYASLAEVFFRAAGLGTVKDFAAWAGLSQRDAKEAVELLPLLPVAIEEVDEMHWVLEEMRDLPDLAEGAAEAVALLPFEDNLLALHGGASLLVDPAHHGTPVPSWGSSKPSTLGEARHMSMRTVVADGRIIGFWEYDPDARAVVAGYFDIVSTAIEEKVRSAAEDLTRFIAEDIGHGRSFSLDTDDELRQRAAFVRKM